MSDHVGLNGDLPADVIDRAVTDLTTAADELRTREDALRAELDAVRTQRHRLDKAVTALTAQPSAKGKPGPKPKGKTNAGDPNYAPGQPRVSQPRLDTVLDALTTLGHAAGSRELGEVSGLSRQTVTSALAHLRHRGLIRYAGKMEGTSGHLYAPFSTDTEEVS